MATNRIVSAGLISYFRKARTACGILRRAVWPVSLKPNACGRLSSSRPDARSNPKWWIGPMNPGRLVLFSGGRRKKHCIKEANRKKESRGGGNAFHKGH